MLRQPCPNALRHMNSGQERTQKRAGTLMALQLAVKVKYGE
jgi:hypothetical protein